MRPAKAAQARRTAVRVNGNDFGLRFWDAVAAKDQKTLKKIVAADSPAAAVFRLYGPAGALIAADVPSGEMAVELTTRHLPTAPGVLDVTIGAIITKEDTYLYSLRWGTDTGKPLVHEILPQLATFASNKLFAFGGQLDLSTSRSDLPPPVAELDDVAARLWRVTMPVDGFPLTLRCLAAWWRAVEELPSMSHPAPVVAAAVTRLVSWRAGLRNSTDVVAARFRVDPAQVRAAEKPLQRVLSLSDARAW